MGYDPGSVIAGQTSELKLQRKLNRTRSANLIERIESAAGAASSQTVGERPRRAAEQGAGQGIGGIAEVGMVEDVEELGAETQTHLLGEMKISLR